MKENEKDNIIERPPVVVIMGHIDHGKSTLLDYIRKTNIVDDETGGITQRISAYEVIHKNEGGKDKKITFLDTPGHEAFSKMRERGAHVADIAVLVVSAEDGVKPQTIEAWKTISVSATPCIVAINKIDKPAANIEKTKNELAENEIYLENYGGKIPCVEISAKVGTGVDNLLSLILILAEIENFIGNVNENASGLIIESNLDAKKGIQATLIIKNGTLKKEMTVVAEDAITSTRSMENSLGKIINEAMFSSPIRLTGFNKIPKVGSEFKSFYKKKDAEEYTQNFINQKLHTIKEQKKEIERKPKGDETTQIEEMGKKIIPIILKANVSGSIEAIEKEINKIKNDNIEFKIVQKGVGPISESDIKSITVGENALVVGFNIRADKGAVELALKRNISINFFDIIYKLTEWLTVEMENRRPKIETVETTGQAKILKAFSRTKERQILGGKVIKGNITIDGVIKIIRREFEIGRGKIVNLEKNKVKVKEVEEGTEFGMMIESKIEIAQGDVIESFAITQR